jgi:Fe(3+) dicitrate transport protein
MKQVTDYYFDLQNIANIDDCSDNCNDNVLILFKQIIKSILRDNSNYDITIKGSYPKDVSFVSSNAAVFLENIFKFSDKLYLIPGIRYEWLEGSAAGRNGLSTNGIAINLQNITRSRNFILAGVGSEYHISKSTEFYTNLSQAYRPIQFANLQAPPTTDVVDPDLKDSKGYNFDIGYRGKVKNYIQFDISGFYLKYTL